MPEVQRIKRSQFATFLKVADNYERMGKGITTASVAYNPTVNDEQFIDEDSGTKEVDGYAPTMSTEQTAYKGNPIFDYVDGLRRKRAVGNDAKTTMLLVYIYEKDGENGYKAEEQEVSISINEFGGDAGNANKITYDIGFCGDSTIGTATITNGTVTFTKGTVTVTKGE